MFSVVGAVTLTLPPANVSLHALQIDKQPDKIFCPNPQTTDVTPA